MKYDIATTCTCGEQETRLVGLWGRNEDTVWLKVTRIENGSSYLASFELLDFVPSYAYVPKLVALKCLSPHPNLDKRYFKDQELNLFPPRTVNWT